MATRYTCTINVRCWKQHTCVACGGQFSYLFLRKVTGTAGSPAASQATAARNVKKRMDSDVDSQPCPACGIYQPDMIGQRRNTSQVLLFVLSAVATGVLFLLSVTHAVQDDVFVPSAAITLAAIGLLQFFIDAQRPNGNLDANRQLALDAMQRGVLRLDGAGRAPAALEEVWRPKASLLRPAAYALCLVGLIAIMWPSLARKSHGWPFNAYCYPPVVGPGDSTCFYMRQSIHSIKGYFRAQVKATAREDNGPEFPLAAHSSDADWGTSIQAKSAEKTGTARLWVTLGVPDKPELAGKQIECQVDLTATFPVVDPNGNTFHVEHGQFQDRLTLQLAPPRAGRTYRTIWWCGAFGGMGLFLLSGFLRIGDAQRLRRQALPTKVYKIPEAGNEGTEQG